ncbi:MAG TPA: HD domain-containing phosphohydrolase [Anaerolineae bacterium]
MDLPAIRVLVISRDAALARRIESLLSGAQDKERMTCTCASSIEIVPVVLKTSPPDVMLLDCAQVESMDHLRELAPDVPVIVCGGETTDGDGIDATHLDAYSLRRAVRHAYERAELAQTRRQLTDLQLVYTMSKVINGNLDLRLKLGIVLEQVINLLGIDAADILLLDARSKTLHYAVGRGFSSKALLFNSIELTQAFATSVVAAQKIITLSDLTHAAPDARPLVVDEGFNTYFGMPLIAKNQLQGVLSMFKRSPFEPDAVWIGFVETFARQAAGAIATTLFESSLKTRIDAGPYEEGGIEEWSRAIDQSTREVAGHSRRVADLSVQIGRLMGMSDVQLLHVRQGALLHDIGKMGIADDVLLKPGPLTAEEWALMRQHPLYGYHMLAGIDYLQAALDIPYAHHEHWDGTGYPRGLAGEQIPLAARVFAVADVWDALCSDRPFRKAWTHRQAYELISQESGSLFDPAIVDAFKQLINAEAG